MKDETYSLFAMIMGSLFEKFNWGHLSMYEIKDQPLKWKLISSLMGILFGHLKELSEKEAKYLLATNEDEKLTNKIKELIMNPIYCNVILIPHSKGDEERLGNIWFGYADFRDNLNRRQINRLLKKHGGWRLATLKEAKKEYGNHPPTGTWIDGYYVKLCEETLLQERKAKYLWVKIEPHVSYRYLVITEKTDGKPFLPYSNFSLF